MTIILNFVITGSFGSQVFEEGYGDHCIVFAVLWILFSCVELIQILFSLKVLIFYDRYNSSDLKMQHVDTDYDNLYIGMAKG